MMMPADRERERHQRERARAARRCARCRLRARHRSRFGARRRSAASLSRSLFSAVRTLRLASLSPHSRPFGRADFAAEPRQLLAEFHELLDALGELGELRGVGAADTLAPFGDDRGDALVELEQQVAVALRGRDVGRHVDAARFHHHRVDQAVDALDVLRAEEGLLRSPSVSAACCRALTTARTGERDGGGGEQREDRIELGRDRKSRQFRHGPRYPLNTRQIGPSNCPQSVNRRLSIWAARP